MPSTPDSASTPRTAERRYVGALAAFALLLGVASVIGIFVVRADDPDTTAGAPTATTSAPSTVGSTAPVTTSSPGVPGPTSPATNAAAAQPPGTNAPAAGQPPSSAPVAGQPTTNAPTAGQPPANAPAAGQPNAAGSADQAPLTRHPHTGRSGPFLPVALLAGLGLAALAVRRRSNTPA